MSSEQLTPTSYLVLGLVAREGPSTPYALKRHVATTLGHFWSFPHTLLYGEPARLAGFGLLTEHREGDGRRRRIFAITDAGRAALQSWLGRPSEQPTELRDLGLLQLFFADLGAPDARRAIARAQLEVHRARLADYAEDMRAERGPADGESGRETAERWRGETVRMGFLYEQAAVQFWESVAAADSAGVAEGAVSADAARVRARAEDDGATIRW